MSDPTTRPDNSPQQPATAAPEVVRLSRDDPAAGPSPQQQAENVPKPPPRRDNQGEAITGAPTV